jgi:purine catabolism regulator
LLAQTRRAITHARCAALSATVGDRVMALVAVNEKDPLQVLDAIGSEIESGLAGRAPRVDAVVGLSGPAGIDALPRAFEEAREAVRYGVTIGRGSGVFRYGDLGLHQLLLRLASGPDLARFVESELGRLLEHDARSSAPLLPTLRAYLDHGGSKTACAKALRIERRSIYHRLERIRKLLRDDLDDPEVRARLTVALRGLDLLRRQSHIPRNVPANGGTD